MSTGPSPACEGRADAGGPVPPARAYLLARLESELRQAGPRQAAAIAARMRELSAGTPADPARETAGRR